MHYWALHSVLLLYTALYCNYTGSELHPTGFAISYCCSHPMGLVNHCCTPASSSVICTDKVVIRVQALQVVTSKPNPYVRGMSGMAGYWHSKQEGAMLSADT